MLIGERAFGPSDFVRAATNHSESATLLPRAAIFRQSLGYQHGSGIMRGSSTHYGALRKTMNTVLCIVLLSALGTCSAAPATVATIVGPSFRPLSTVLGPIQYASQRPPLSLLVGSNIVTAYVNATDKTAFARTVSLRNKTDFGQIVLPMSGAGQALNDATFLSACSLEKQDAALFIVRNSNFTSPITAGYIVHSGPRVAGLAFQVDWRSESFTLSNAFPVEDGFLVQLRSGQMYWSSISRTGKLDSLANSKEDSKKIIQLNFTHVPYVSSEYNDALQVIESQALNSTHSYFIISVRGKTAVSEPFLTTLSGYEAEQRLSSLKFVDLEATLKTNLLCPETELIDFRTPKTRLGLHIGVLFSCNGSLYVGHTNNSAELWSMRWTLLEQEFNRTRKYQLLSPNLVFYVGEKDQTMYRRKYENGSWSSPMIAIHKKALIAYSEHNARDDFVLVYSVSQVPAGAPNSQAPTVDVRYVAFSADTKVATGKIALNATYTLMDVQPLINEPASVIAFQVTYLDQSTRKTFLRVDVTSSRS